LKPTLINQGNEDSLPWYFSPNELIVVSDKTTITGYIRDVNGGKSAGKCLTIGHRPRAVIDFAAKIKIRLTFYGLIR
jgi:hypothetical protein